MDVVGQRPDRARRAEVGSMGISDSTECGMAAARRRPAVLRSCRAPTRHPRPGSGRYRSRSRGGGAK